MTGSIKTKKLDRKPQDTNSYSWRQRQLVHKHNGLTGSIRMAMMQMDLVAKAQSTTPDAKELALEIYADLVVLSTYLNTRINLDGSVSQHSGDKDENGETR